MAHTGTMTLIDQAKDFFAVIKSAPEAGAPIAPYPVKLMITTPEESFTVQFKDGVPGEVTAAAKSAKPGLWTYELRGEREVFEAIFAGAMTMGEAMFAAILVAPEEKSKHNLSSAVGQTLRLTQDVHRRAGDPRKLSS